MSLTTDKRSLLDECPWTVLHGDHRAWYQRALLVGDLAPGRPPIAEYVVYSDGRAADPEVEPRCEGCGSVVSTLALTVVETATGRRDFLAEFRAGRRSWPRPTDQERCWWCHDPNAPLVNGRTCVACESHLRRG